MITADSYSTTEIFDAMCSAILALTARIRVLEWALGGLVVWAVVFTVLLLWWRRNVKRRLKKLKGATCKPTP